MKRIGASALAVTFAAMLTLAVPALAGTTVGNDDFDDAIGLGAAGSTDGTNFPASAEPSEPQHAGQGGASVWYRWTPQVSGPYHFDTASPDTDFDTVIAVYTGGSVDNLQLVAENDDLLDGERFSGVEFAATAGQEYRIAVDGFSASGAGPPSTGDFELNWGERFVKTELTKRPPKVLRGRRSVKATVGFESTNNTGFIDPSARFECRLDSGKFKSCESTKTYSVRVKRKPKRHTIAVRTVDPYGNVDETPAKTSFKVKRKGQRR